MVKRKKEIELKVEILEKNNKKYLKVKTKGIPAKKWIWRGENNVDNMINFYLTRYVEKRTKRNIYEFLKKSKSTALERYTKKIKESPVRIRQNLGKGEFKQIIENNLKTDIDQLKLHKDKLLSQIVLSPKLRKILSTEENMNKYKELLGYEIYFYGRNKQLAETAIYNVTPEQMFYKLKQFKENEIVDEGSKQFWKKCKYLGLNTPRIITEGNIKRIEVKMIFRNA